MHRLCGARECPFYSVLSNAYKLCSSTRNTRIERTWGEVGSQFARCWRAFFTRLETEYFLDVANPAHLWLLTTIFLDDLNADCAQFVQDWNAHAISGTRTNEKSPRVSPYKRLFLSSDI